MVLLNNLENYVKEALVNKELDKQHAVSNGTVRATLLFFLSLIVKFEHFFFSFFQEAKPNHGTMEYKNKINLKIVITILLLVSIFEYV